MTGGPLCNYAVGMSLRRRIRHAVRFLELSGILLVVVLFNWFFNRLLDAIPSPSQEPAYLEWLGLALLYVAVVAFFLWIFSRTNKEGWRIMSRMLGWKEEKESPKVAKPNAREFTEHTREHPSHSPYFRSLQRLDRMFALTDLFGIVVGYFVGKGLVTPIVYSVYFLLPFFLAVIITGLMMGIFRGTRTLFRMAGYTFYVVAWLMGLLATFFVGVGIDILYLSQNPAGGFVFALLLVLYLYSAWLKYRLRGPIGLNP